MLPGIAPGARILVNKLAYRKGPIGRGDRVVFINPNARYARYVKRVVALPGDVIEMQNNDLIINGQRLNYEDVNSASGSGKERIESAGTVRYPILVSSVDVNPHATRNFPAQKVPNGHCFVLCDNRQHSEDSRVHGPVPLTDVVGRVEKVF
jgi:signal peptidase I